MEKELWLTRDDDGWYGIYINNPEKICGDWEGDTVIGTILRSKQFRAIFGCHLLRKGRKKRIKRILIELED